jgi:hypothetical protein
VLRKIFTFLPDKQQKEGKSVQLRATTVLKTIAQVLKLIKHELDGP